MTGHPHRKRHLLYRIVLLSCFLGSGCTTSETVTIQPPEKLYGALFYDVQNDTALFSDSKTFPDCIPQLAPETIRKQYERLGPLTGTALATFVNKTFLPPPSPMEYQASDVPINDHIASLWNTLQRPPDIPRSGTLIPLPYSYIVPGGRFREIYYWDSYFTMLGLAADGSVDIMKNMVDNFSYLIDTLGHIPNGNRTYYLSRSQPPFYSRMVALLTQTSDSIPIDTYISAIEKEYAFWMKGSSIKHASGTASERVVWLDSSLQLNRYWDALETPRPESYREDVATAKEAVANNPSVTSNEVYRNLRAAAESGWDFSSRWMVADSQGTFSLVTIHTTDIIPVCLNSLLYTTEKMLYTYYTSHSDSEKSVMYQRACTRRKKALYRYCWNSTAGYFFDYDFKKHKHTPVLSAAGAYPLFSGIVDTADAVTIAQTIATHLLKPGGITATVNKTGQQWDAPNGWAPLQWIAIAGLRNYGEEELAETIANRWCTLNRKVFRTNRKMIEKYNVCDTTRESGGGEYPTQDGFGWTNGVYRALADRLPVLHQE